MQNDVLANKDVLKSLRKQYEYQEEYHTYKRHVFSGVKAWAFYMYSVDKISTEAVLSFVSNELMPVDAPSDTIRDVLFFRSGLRSYSYLGWGNWNDEKPHPGIVYTPPSPSYWLTLGFLAEQIRENTLFFNLEDFDAKALENIEYLSQTIAEQCQYFITHFDKWKAVLNSPNTDDLIAKCSNIKSVFNAVNAKRTTEVERAIVNSPLAPRYVNEFKSNVGASWRNSARMRQLFKKNRNAVLILNDDIKLKRIGQRTFFEKAKIMFIDNEFHQKIHNMEVIGAQTGTWEDDEFFNTIIKNNLLYNTGSSYIDAIDIALKDLNTNGVTPTAIFISREATYSEHEFTDSPRFTSRYNEATTNQELRGFYLGTFDGIAVYCPFSNFIRNRVIVCDFAQSFEMIYKTHLDWFDEELNIEIKEVTPSDALRKLDENPSKWKLTEDGSEISNDEALLKVSTSVIMDIWSVADFRIKSSTSYVVVNVKA
ncbi:MAG: hypothetical protein EOP45_11560 [Sphingobacteriaceae bacterium]|nr:MAG: hypothetical protein EOP45_11560 [Sphingobacteriaceae bacterium]